jgi:hypothetical protein
VLAVPLLALELGLVEALVSSVSAAAFVLSPEVVPADADGDVPDCDTEGDSEAPDWLPLAAAEAGGLSLAAVEWVTDEPDGDADEDAEPEDEAEPDADAEADADGEPDAEVDGEGEEEACAGSGWHTVSAGCAASGAACAPPARLRLSKPPPSMVAAAALTCAKRIKIACLR